MNPPDNIIDYLNAVAPIIPFPIYWTDLEARVLGMNQACLIEMGAKNINDIVGKKLHDYYPKDSAASIASHIELVLKSNQTHTQEDVIHDISSGKTRYYAAIRSPLIGRNGEIVGVFGTFIDITAEKEVERLKMDIELQKIAILGHEKFRKTADKVAHDIRSPLASLTILAKICTTVPERQRIALKEVATAIGDIANNLVSKYQFDENGITTGNDEECESVLISSVLLQLLTAKKYQYQGCTVKFDYHFSPAGEFSWIYIQPSALNLTLSNIINNVVDAFDQSDGVVTLYLDADEQQVRVTIADNNGKGMSAEFAQKIISQDFFNESTLDWRRTGASEVKGTLQNGNGQWEIQSRTGQGTKIILMFPRTSALSWLAEKIQLNEGDTIVILDDDSSIHLAWDLWFEKYLEDYPNLKLKHFSDAQETIDFICALDENEKKKCFLLSDYELLDPKLNGLDVIVKTKMSRSILVTSYFDNDEVRQSASQHGTKILPKQLVSNVPVEISEAMTIGKSDEADLKLMDAIFVDDEQYLLDGFKMLMYGKDIDTYQNPQDFLENVGQYHRDTKIMLDQNYANYHKKGLDIAEQLNAMGFTRLYLLSGEHLSTLKIPAYVTPIRKADINALEAALGC